MKEEAKRVGKQLQNQLFAMNALRAATSGPVGIAGLTAGGIAELMKRRKKTAGVKTAAEIVTEYWDDVASDLLK